MTREEAKEIIERHNTGTASQEEVDLLERAYARIADREAAPVDVVRVAEAKADVWGRLTRSAAHPRRLTRWLPYAAAVVIVFAIGWWVMQDRQPTAVSEQIVDIAPGGNRAMLTLADGRTIALDEAQSGIIIDDEITYADGSQITADGQLLFGFSTVDYQLATPKGGTYQLTLPDGTEVWLNSASSLSYPSRFDGAERRVTLEGEAYFAVSRDTEKPFRVVTSGQTVEVLGTEFNVSAYTDEPETRTTLVEGRVRVAGEVLSPSQQAITRQGKTAIKQVDISAVTAWKDGKFDFSEQSLDAVMRQIARWYDVEVEFADEVDRNEQYWGSVSRFSNISQVLTKLEQTGNLRFAIKERRVIVTKEN